MPKVTQITCDLCGGSDMGSEIVFKVKKRWFSWYETGLSTKKIYICEGCQESLKNAAIQDRKLREKERRKKGKDDD